MIRTHQLRRKTVKTKALISALVLISGAFSTTAMAVEKGDMMLRFGVASVSPSSNNHDLVSVDSDDSLAINFSYFFSDNFALEVLGAYPFEHDIRLKGGDVVASTEHLPPTITAQWHFMPTKDFKPYVGLGINYTAFFSEKTTGALEGLPFRLSTSTGLAAEIGADFQVLENWYLNLSARYIDIGTTARLDHNSLGKVDIDPYVYSVMLGHRF
jgi:outer membrane protein